MLSFVAELRLKFGLTSEINQKVRDIDLVHVLVFCLYRSCLGSREEGAFKVVCANEREWQTLQD